MKRITLSLLLLAAVSGLAADDFFGRMYREMAQDTQGNLVFSPFSIALALSMAAEGAKGETLAELTALLDPETPGLPRTDPAEYRQLGDTELVIANSAWIQRNYQIHYAYLEALQRLDAGLFIIDFADDPDLAAQTISGWVSAATRDRIADLLGPGSLDPLTRLVLVNAVYFKAEWTKPFPAYSTRKGLFRNQDGREAETDFMHQTGTFEYCRDGGIQILSLPYGDGRFAMLIILPAPGALAEVEKALSLHQVLLWRHASSPERVRIALPRFSADTQTDVAGVLRRLGCRLPFVPEADFSGIAAEDGLHISSIIHRADIDVYEEGSEAAAATAVAVGVTSAPVMEPEPLEFTADRPFLYLIIDRYSADILFAGRQAEF